jgi:glycosyltransferase involved in cell wall biosynthesis
LKIALVSNLYPPFVQGGAEIYVGRLAAALADDHRVVVISSEPGAHLSPRRELSPEGITVYRLAPFNVAHLSGLPHHLLAQAAFRALDLYHPQVAATVGDILARERPDVVHIHNWVGLSLAATLAAVGERIPVAMTLHDYALLCAYASIRHPDGHACAPDLLCRSLAAFNRRLTASVRLAISPSHYVLDQHLRRGFFHRAAQQVLPYGLELPSPLVQRVAPRLSKPTFDVLFLGRVQSYKGIELLVRAFRRLEDPSFRLHVAGAGPSLDTTKALAAGDDRIRFYGFVSGETRRALIENADTMVLPSLWPDNYPVSIQEAFQSGAIVIASRVGGIPEMIRDGVNGLLVEPGDEVGIGAAVEGLRQSPERAARLRAAARETVRLYDMRFHVAHLTDAYRQLLKASRAGDLDRRVA